MSELSSEFRYYRTTDADAVAADLAAGKIAYNNEGELVGVGAAAPAGTILYWEFSGLDFSDPIVAALAAEGVQLNQTGLSYNGDGTVTNTAGYQTLRATSMPVKSTGHRRYIINIRIPVSAVYPDRIELLFNYVDSDNYWLGRLIRGSSTYSVEFYKRVAGAETGHGTVSMSSVCGDPCVITLHVDDFGDSIIISETGFETDSTGDDSSASLSYYIASRPHKTAQDFHLRWTAGIGKFDVQSILVVDIP